MDSPETIDGGGGIPEEISGDRYLREGSYERAARLFMKASQTSPEERGRLVHRAAVAWWKAGLYDRAAETFRDAVEEFRRTGDRSAEARNVLGQGASYHGLNRMSEAYRIIHDALEIAEELEDDRTVADAINWLGIICKDQGDYSLALQHHSRALELKRKLGDDIQLAAPLNSMGLTYFHMGKYQRAMDCFDQALEIQRRMEDPWGLPDTLNSIGMTLHRMGRTDQALEVYKEALDARKKSGGKARTANILNNMGNLYTTIGDIDSAVRCHSEALAIRRDISSRSGIASSLLNLGETYRASGQLHRAASCLEDSLGHQQNNRPDETMMDTIRMLAEVRQMMGESGRAYELSQRSLELMQELYRDQAEKRVMESREILETEHRMREAKLLVARNRKLRDLSDMLATQKEQLQLILDYVPAIILFIDNGGTVIRLNRYASELCGKEPRELVGANSGDFFGSVGRSLFEIRGQGSEDTDKPLLDSEEKVRLKDGEHIFLCHRVPHRGSGGEVAGTVVFAVDTTDEKRAERRKREIQVLTSKAKRLESLGHLAGTIAHDFNNLLLGIMGNVELVHGRVGDPASRSNLEKASENTRRAAELCDQLLAFSGGGSFDLKRLDLSSEVSFILRSFAFDPEISFQFTADMAEELPEIDMSTTQLRLTMRNLLDMTGGAKGSVEKVRVATGRVTADPGYIAMAVHDTEAEPGDYLYVEVTGGGRRYSREEFSSLFDPFTSGDVLRADLRMPAVQGILRSLGGFMTCAEEGVSGVRVHFPCPRTPSEPERVSGSVPARRRTPAPILIVDDEPSVRETAGELLASMGYEVLSCSGGVAALEILEDRAARVSCVLLDITMPDMSGHEVISEISRLHPEMDVILTSGFSEKMIVESRDNPCYRGFLKKPYSMSQLRSTVQGVIGGGSPPAAAEQDKSTEP